MYTNQATELQKYIKQTPIELKRDINKLPVRDVNILLLSVDRVTKQKNDTEKRNI